MTKKSFTINLVLAVAFLVVANVQADLITSIEGLEKYKDTKDPLYALSVTTSHNDYYGADPVEGYTRIGDAGGLTYAGAGEGNSFLRSWTLNTDTPTGYKYFTISNVTGEGFGLSVNGTSLIDKSTSIFTSSPWSQNMLDGVLYVGEFNAKNLSIVFDAFLGAGSDGNGIPSPSFILTFYGDGTTGAPGITAPEPATLAVLGLGLAGLGAVSRRRRK